MSKCLLHTRGAKFAQQSCTLSPSDQQQLREGETEAVVTGRSWAEKRGGEGAAASTFREDPTRSWMLECSPAPGILSFPSTCSKIYDARNSWERKVNGKLNHSTG